MSFKTLKQHLEMMKFSGIREIYVGKDSPLKKNQAANSKTNSPARVATPSLKGRLVESLTHRDASGSLILPQQLNLNVDILPDLHKKYAICTKCKLHEHRQNFVYGEGSASTGIMIIGEGPGEQEDKTGRPFVGAAGQLLEKMLLAINLQRSDVYITNIVKCRPPGNRNPEPEEREACLPYLLEQISIIKPKIFLLLGLVAAQTMLNSKLQMSVLRCDPLSLFGRPAYVTYHPSALLRNPNWKRPAWEDLQKFRDCYLSIIDQG